MRHDRLFHGHVNTANLNRCHVFEGTPIPIDPSCIQCMRGHLRTFADIAIDIGV